MKSHFTEEVMYMANANQDYETAFYTHLIGKFQQSDDAKYWKGCESNVNRYIHSGKQFGIIL